MIESVRSLLEQLAIEVESLLLRVQLRHANQLCWIIDELLEYPSVIVQTP